MKVFNVAAAAIVVAFSPPVVTAQPAGVPVDGHVIRLGSGQPIARARVTLTDLQGNAEDTVSVVADVGGHFVFPSVPPGSYRLSAARDGFLLADYGQRAIGKAGVPLVVGDGHPPRNVVVVMVPMGAIAGRVYDAYGDPVVNASVQALKYGYQDGRRILTTVRTVTTNDLGQYRLYWMRPGQYVVSASVAPPAGANPVRDSAGNVLAQSAEAHQRYVPHYLPGVTDAAAASVLDLAPGAEFSGADFYLQESRAGLIRGHVTDARTGMPAAGASVALVPRRAMLAGGASRATSRVTAQGAFEFRDVPSGSYEIVARAQSSGRAGASAPVDVGAEDIDVSLSLAPAFNISGRLFAEGDLAPASAAALTKINLRLESVSERGAGASATVAPNGLFTITGLTPGEYRLQVTGLPADAYVKSARLGRTDFLGTTARIQGAGQDLLDISIGGGAATFDVVAIDARQQPIVDTKIVLVPDPARRPRLDLYYAVSTNAEGRAHVEGIEPGDYTVLMFDDVEDGAWEDPDFLRLYDSRGIAIHLAAAAAEALTFSPRPGAQ